MKLYVYDHCPYCVKARMIFALKNIPFTLITLLNDDEETPIRMIGKKVVPILQLEDGSYMPESMDIVRLVDSYDDRPIVGNAPDDSKVGAWLEEARSYLYKLTMPRWVQTPLEEFKTESARRYFVTKKEAMIGSFEEHLKNTPALKGQAEQHLKLLDAQISSPEAVHGTLTEDDFHVFAVLRSLTIVKDLEYPLNLQNYTRRMSEKTKVPLYTGI